MLVIMLQSVQSAPYGLLKKRSLI
ncbi:hypothetical protein TNCT_644951, partial [Trichonephila clavata]